MLSTLSASTIFIIDRVEGVWDRILVAGASAEEMLLGHFLVNSMILLIQCTEIITISAVSRLEIISDVVSEKARSGKIPIPHRKYRYHIGFFRYHIGIISNRAYSMSKIMEVI